VLWREGEEEAFALGQRLKKQPRGRIVDESDLYAAGVALLHNGQALRSEQVLSLNARLYPGSVRTLLALSRAQAAAGETTQALESARKALALKPQNGFAKVQIARLGAPVEGHTALALPLDRVRPLIGVYLSTDTRYVVEIVDGHLLVHAYKDGELSGEFEAFAEDEGRFFVPADGTLIRFGMSATGDAETLDGTAGKETWHARRSQ
jgi:tetratricopeptide (TPR) repeat protein